MSRIPALFLNSPRAQCSIHESGRMVFAAIQDSDVFDWDYADLHQGYQPEKKRYGCVVFNYHPGTMPWLDTETVRRIGCLKGTMILETLPESVFPLCPRDVFDVHLAIDPTAIEEPGRVYAMPRPLEEILAPVAPSAAELRHPVIGTFGFGTPGKGFERVVDAVNREFDSATIRVNIPEADFADGAMLAMHRMPYAQYLVELMRRVAKPGVVIEATRVFHSPPDLIRWCRSNTLNVFLYDRGGLRAAAAGQRQPDVPASPPLPARLPGMDDPGRARAGRRVRGSDPVRLEPGSLQETVRVGAVGPRRAGRSVAAPAGDRPVRHQVRPQPVGKDRPGTGQVPPADRPGDRHAAAGRGAAEAGGTGPLGAPVDA